jgi:hypothetical protein
MIGAMLFAVILLVITIESTDHGGGKRRGSMLRG